MLGSMLGLLSGPTDSSPDVAFMLVTTTLVQFMTPGLGMFYAGLCRPNGALTVMAMSITAMGIVTMLWFTIGFGMAFGPSWDPWNLIGNPFSYLLFGNISGFKELKIPGTDDAYGVPGLPGWLYALFQNKFAVISPALASGAVVDRLNIKGWIAFMILWVVFIYCPWCRQLWGNGYYAQRGAVDFAGGIVIHTTSGWTALVLAKMLGNRKHCAELPHSVPLVVIGTALLWFGWFGFNGGSAYSANSVAIVAAVNSQVAAASAMVGWGIMSCLTTGKVGLVPLCVGAVAGLATVTPAAGFIQPSYATLYGLLASVICFYCIHLMKYLGVDDALDVCAVHGVGGSLGSIMIGIFADPPACVNEDPPPDYCVNPGAVARGWSQLGLQTEATLVCLVYSMAVSWLIVKALSAIMEISPQTTKIDDELLGEEGYNMADDAPLDVDRDENNEVKAPDVDNLNTWLLDPNATRGMSAEAPEEVESKSKGCCSIIGCARRK